MIPVWDKRVADWVSPRVSPADRGFGKCQALGVVHKGELVAGLVFHNWEPEAGVIEISGAAKDARWMTRAVMNTALGYVFDGLECQMVLARQRKYNIRPRKAWLALGGSEVVIPRLYGRGQDGTIITLTAEQWRASKFYQGGTDGQK
jgi:hypothetical protein